MQLDSFIKECHSGTPKCPACGAELVAREGAREPFYWECSLCGYKQNANDHPLVDGKVVCTRCGEPVEFALHGETAVWRCTKNPHHRIRIIRAHLLLPGMRELVPGQVLRKLDARLGVDGAERNERAGLFARELRPALQFSTSANAELAANTLRENGIKYDVSPVVTDGSVAYHEFVNLKLGGVLLSIDERDWVRGMRLIQESSD
jgi:ribosomal protein S27AE